MIRSRRHKNKRAFGSRRGDKQGQSSAGARQSSRGQSNRGLQGGRSSGRTKGAVKLDKSIVLIGLMGAGKTTVGRRLARALGVGFVDSDHEIEKAAAMSVSDIFESYGEKEFRAVERRVIQRLMTGRPKIIATGGGAFMDKETRMLIKAEATSVWLNADIDVLVERTSRRDTRPLLKQGDPVEILKRLAEERNPIYSEATLMVKSQDGPHENVVSSLLKILRSYYKDQQRKKRPQNQQNRSHPQNRTYNSGVKKVGGQSS